MQRESRSCRERPGSTFSKEGTAACMGAGKILLVPPKQALLLETNMNNFLGIFQEKSLCFNINSQGILKGAVKTDLKVVNISNFNLSGTVSTYCIQILILETHQRFRKIQTASKFTFPPCRGHGANLQLARWLILNLGSRFLSLLLTPCYMGLSLSLEGKSFQIESAQLLTRRKGF